MVCLILSCPWGTALVSLRCGWYLWFIGTPHWPPLLKSVAPSLAPGIPGCFSQPRPLLGTFSVFASSYWKYENVKIPKIAHASSVTYWRHHLKPTPGHSLQTFLIYFPEPRRTSPELQVERHMALSDTQPAHPTITTPTLQFIPSPGKKEDDA